MGRRGRMKGLLLAVCCALALLVPVAAADAATSSTSKQGKVAVGAKIKRFAVVDRKIVARGVLTSRVSGAGSTQAARTPVTFAVASQAGRCQVLTLTLNDLQLSLLGLNVDLSEVNLPAGSRLAVGTAILEVSETPHTGCAKFSARFGTDALKFVNKSPGRELRLRGVNTRVVTPGTVRAGDAISKL